MSRTRAFVEEFKRRIAAQLDKQTNWGKEQVKKEIDKAIIESLLETEE